MKKLCLALAFACGWLIAAQAQSPAVWQWAVVGGGNYSDERTSCAFDSSGSIYSSPIVRFTNSSFPPIRSWIEGASPPFTMPQPGVTTSTFEIGGDTASARVGYYAMTIDFAGNLYATGEMDKSQIGLTVSGGSDILLMKVRTNFTVQPSRFSVIAGGSGNDSGRAITTDRLGNVYVTGYFSSVATFGGLAIGSSGGEDIFIAKYDATGNRLWVRAAGGAGQDRGLGIASDTQNEIYITGFFSGNATFGSTSFSSSGGTDIFVAKMDSQGNFLWVKSAGDAGNDSGRGIVVDSVGRVNTVGTFSGIANFGTIQRSSIGGSDIFVAQYTRDGNVAWANSAGGSADDDGNAITVDSDGSIYSTGAFRGQAAFGSVGITSMGDADVFVACYNSSGSFFWVTNAGGGSFDTGHAIAVDASRRVLVSGAVSDCPVRFGSISYSWSPAVGGLCDRFNSQAFIGFLDPVPLQIINQPQNVTATVGSSASVSVIVSGTPPVSFQWRKNGAPIAEATNRVLLFSNLQTSDGGVYSVAVSNFAGTIFSSAATVTVTIVPPSITEQPRTQSVPAGSTVSFSVGVSGTPPFGYQWRKNGVNLTVGTSATLTLTDVRGDDSGRYSVLVSNAANTVTSMDAILTVNDPPIITTEPTDQSASAGSAVSFSVAVIGVSPISYQWFRDGAQIPGAVNANLVLSDVQYNGLFSVAVSNAGGTTISRAAVLSAFHPPGGEIKPPANAALTNVPPTGPAFTPPDAGYWDIVSRKLYAVKPGPITITWRDANNNPVVVSASIRSSPSQTYLLGQQINPPANADTSRAPSTEPVDVAFWHAPTRQLYAVAPSSLYTITWRNAADAPVPVQASNFWPTNEAVYQVHVANTPAVQLGSVAAYSWSQLTAQESTVGASEQEVRLNQRFTATGTGRTLILLSQSIPQASSNIYFQFVKTINWTDSNYLRDHALAIIGEEVVDSLGYHNPSSGGPYVLNALSRYCADTNYHQRESRTGPIIPVNRDRGSDLSDDLVIVYYQQGIKLIQAGTQQVISTSIGWPYQPVRYDCQWPPDPEKIVIASQQGTGEINSSLFWDWDLYIQNDPQRPGFNPNDEHAVRFPFGAGEAIFALRDDLGTPDTSDAYVLMKYRDGTSGGARRLKVYKVVAEEPPNVIFRYPTTVGNGPLQPPFPLSAMQKCEESRGVSGPYWRDRNGDFWVKSAGDDGGATNVVMEYYYTVQNGFFFPGGSPPAVGQHVPWLDLRAGTPGTPIDVIHVATWPSAPVLAMGETLVRPKPGGLPDIGGQTSVELLYQQSQARHQSESVKLIDATRIREVALERLPDDVTVVSEGPLKFFPTLPPQLRLRFWYDSSAKRLRFGGQFVAPTAGEYYLLLNVVSERERQKLLDLSRDTTFINAVGALSSLASDVIEVPPNTPFSPPLALTAGSAKGLGYVTLAFNNSTNLNQPADPVSLKVIRVDCPVYRGELKPIRSDNPFDERFTLRHSGDFAARSDEYFFDWRSLPPDVDGNPQVNVPRTNWTVFNPTPASGRGAVDITIEGPGLYTLSDNYFVCRYRPTSSLNPCGTNWSEWTAPMLAEGWVKRVVGEINPITQQATGPALSEAENRFSSYRGMEANALVSMIGLAGPRWLGGVPLNQSALTNYGLLEIYQTVFERAKGLSIDSAGVNYPPANDSLLLIASRISDLYMLLGNEAQADAADPTIAFGTDDGTYGTEATSIHCFQNQTSSLLEEELVLLRGRDNSKLPSVTTAPFYNRLIWNFTHDFTGGEVAYALNYNIRDQAGNVDGRISESDARRLYPQGHGDAWGHYLYGLKSYYQLLRHPNFTWNPRSEAILVGGVPVSVDFMDERRFAKAALEKARVGADVLNLTYRASFSESPTEQLNGYTDVDTNQAWGLSEWGMRAGQGALFDWITANAILPPTSTNTGVQKVDRTTVPELRELPAAYSTVQDEVDKADQGLNPLGLAKNVVPFDIDPSQIDQCKTHFEQVYDRAVAAMRNAIAVFNHANNSSQLLRRQADSLSDFQRTVEDREADFNSRLIEVFGYPYHEDIGTGGTYPFGYSGPDLYNFMYYDPTPLGLKSAGLIVPFVVTNVEFQVSPTGVLIPSVTTIQYQISGSELGFVKKSNWTTRRAPGELQLAISELLQTKGQFEKAQSDYNNHIDQIEDAAKLLEAQYGLRANELLIQNDLLRTQQSLDEAIGKSRQLQLDFQKRARMATLVANAVSESFPKMFGFIAGLANGVIADWSGALRSAVLFAGNVTAEGNTQDANQQSLVELDHQQAKEIAQYQTTIRLETLRNERAIEQQVLQIEHLVRQEAVLRLEVYTLQEVMHQASGRYMSALARGQRLLEDRQRFRRQTAPQLQAYRYKDIAFRIFRNDALQKYRAQFDLASMYVFLAAAAYDFETNLRQGDSRAPGSSLMSDTVRARTIGAVGVDGPQAGSGGGDNGLAEPMARMRGNWQVIKGQLGFCTPETETGRFSLRSELFRTQTNNNSRNLWREILTRRVVTNILEMPEFQRYCTPFNPRLPIEPGVVITFASVINFGQNFFGWPAGGGDNDYDSSHFSTKVRSVGVWFANYNNLLGSGMNNTPRVYLIPVGSDVLRSPTDDEGITREWKILDQLLPVPFPVSGSSIGSGGFIPLYDSVSGQYADIRKFASFRAYHDSGNFTSAETTTSTRLIGRSVWNTRWLLIIPAGTLHSDRNEGIQRFINGSLLPNGQRDGNGVTDIKIFFQTYSY